MEKVQLLLTEDEIVEAKHMFGWMYWYDTALFSIAVLGLAVSAVAIRDQEARLAILCVLIVFGALALVNLFPRIREYNVFKREIDTRIAESVVAAPQKVWKTKYCFCYVRINGIRIRVPWDRYLELREANLVRIVFLPASRVAIRVEVAQGLGIGM